MRRYELTDEQWAILKSHLPSNGSPGGQWEEHRPIVNGMFWILHSGAAWRDLPERYGPWQTVYDRFNRWQKDGTLDRVLEALQMQLDEEGYIEWDLWCIDATHVRASRAAAGGGKKGVRTNRRTTH